MRKVVITGMGAVSGLGLGTAQTWENVIAGRCAARQVNVTVEGDESLSIEVLAAPATANALDELNKQFGRRHLANVDRFANLAGVAAMEALDEAGLRTHPGLERSAIILGSTSCGHYSIEAGYQRLLGQRLPSVHPMTVPRVMGSAAVAQVSMLFGIRGHCMATSSACASSAHAIGEAMHMIRSGRCDIAIAGGSDASLTYGHLCAWRDIQALSTDACRPFSAGRTGTVLGEGAAIVVLEAEEHASARGAPVLAELCGYGSTSDAAHITQPSVAQAARAIREALTDANLSEATPVLISAHGTGTLLNDRNESAALHQVFGPHLANNLVIATKSGHGHMLGASAAMELILGILALRTGLAPRVVGYLASDSECAIPVAVDNQHIDFGTLVSSSFAFGGMNAVLVARLL
jgi:nodulation protein E